MPLLRHKLHNPQKKNDSYKLDTLPSDEVKLLSPSTSETEIINEIHLETVEDSSVNETTNIMTLKDELQMQLRMRNNIDGIEDAKIQSIGDAHIQIKHNQLTQKNTSTTVMNTSDTEKDRGDERKCGRELIRGYAWRAKSSTSYFILYLILIIANAFVLLWELIGHPKQDIAIITEGVITLTFVAEVSIEILTQGWSEYWNRWAQKVDLSVCALCVILWSVFVSVKNAPDTHHETETVLDAVIVGIRYSVQSVRLCRFGLKGHENTDHLNQSEIVFDEIKTHAVLSEHDTGFQRYIRTIDDDNIELVEMDLKPNTSSLHSRTRTQSTHRKSKSKPTISPSTSDSQSIDHSYSHSDSSPHHHPLLPMHNHSHSNHRGFDNESSDATTTSNHNIFEYGGKQYNHVYTEIQNEIANHPFSSIERDMIG